MLPLCPKQPWDCQPEVNVPSLSRKLHKLTASAFSAVVAVVVLLEGPGGPKN